jgi:hypothetical protein
VDFTRRSSGALGQRALPESPAAQGRDGWPSRPHLCLLPWMTCPGVPLGPDAFRGARPEAAVSASSDHDGRLFASLRIDASGSSDILSGHVLTKPDILSAFH